MFHRLGVSAWAALTIGASLAATAGAGTTPPSPVPFGQYLVYSAAGVYDPSVPPAEGDLADWFHRRVMGRDDAAIAAERAAADTYFSRTFGSLYTQGSLEAFGLDPRNEYRVYIMSGLMVPPEGWVVRDGGFRANLSDGTFVVYGDYNIRVTRHRGKGPDPDPILIHYESLDPIHNHPDGSGYFRCILRSSSFNDFGGGLAQGMFASETLPDGRTVANIRNILTFPGLGLAEEASGAATSSERPTSQSTDRVRLDLVPAGPSPASSLVRIAYRLDESGPVSLRIYDVRGRLVRTLVEGPLQAGDHESVWNRQDDAGREVPSGVYFYRLDSLNGTGLRKVVLVGH